MLPLFDLRDIRTEYSSLGQGGPLSVLHQVCTDPLKPRAGWVQLFEDLQGEANCRTEIAWEERPGAQRLELYWTAAPWCSQVGLVGDPPTGRVFIAAGRCVAVVDLLAGQVLNTFPVECVWSLRSWRGAVLLRSELTCALFARDGTLLREVPVDPPWQEAEDGQGICFDSMVMGRQRIDWPFPG